MPLFGHMMLPVGLTHNRGRIKWKSIYSLAMYIDTHVERFSRKPLISCILYPVWVQLIQSTMLLHIYIPYGSLGALSFSLWWQRSDCSATQCTKCIQNHDNCRAFRNNDTVASVYCYEILYNYHGDFCHIEHC